MRSTTMATCYTSVSNTTKTFIVFVLAFLACNVQVTTAFTSVVSYLPRVSPPPSIVLLAEGSSKDGGDELQESSSPPPPAATPPPAVKPKRMDPLLASLTRLDPAASQNTKTTNIPLLGEVPVDGSLVVLVPAAVIAVLGFLLSINIAMNSSDAIVSALANTGEDITQKAINKASQVYDEDACRGLCSSQEEDLDSLRNFMQGLGK